MKNIDEVRAAFMSPSEQYRSVPFWSWNDRLEPEELCCQVEEMHKGGMGGFFIHSREGLETEYMEEEWDRCVLAVVEKARELGMYAWLYDEDRWPSGSAGGQVQKQGGDAFRAKALTVEELPEAGVYAPDDRAVALFSVRLREGRLESIARRDPAMPAKAEKSERLLVFRKEISAGHMWYNGESPPDVLNPDAVRTFLEITHEHYAKLVGGHFGGTVPGIFTDEPSCAVEFDNPPPYSRGWIPFTDRFFTCFRENRGYDLAEALPYIFYEGESSSKTRHDYWRTVSELFSEVYVKQISDWCEVRGLAMTGHFLLESSLGSTCRFSGAVMQMYRHQHIPGIDILCEQTDETLTVKQCTSVANQYGRDFVLSEMYGCTGWDFDFEGQKRLGDWQYVMGVNLRCPHLSLYSLRGCRKRDFPPSFGYNTSWWKYNRIIEDYFARLGAVLSMGRVVRDLLVLHPVSTAWAMLGGSLKYINRDSDPHLKRVNAYGDELGQLADRLLALHMDFDFGDEIILAEQGRVGVKGITVGEASYRLVLIPPSLTLLQSTLDMLLRYVSKGGRILTLRPVPMMLEGAPSTAVKALLAHPNVVTLDSMDALEGALERLLPRSVSLLAPTGGEAPELLHMLRDGADFQTLFVVNRSDRALPAVTIRLNGAGSPEELDPFTGRSGSIESRIIQGQLQFTADFQPYGSRLYLIGKTTPPNAPAKETNTKTSSGRTLRLAPASFARTAPNSLTLDRCEYRLNDAAWSETTEVWKAQRAIREELKMVQIFRNGIAQRYLWADTPHYSDGAAVELRFSFEVSVLPEGTMYLGLESPDEYAVTFNGSPVDTRSCGWFADKSIAKVRLPRPEKGVNVLILSLRYKNGTELEECYLVGDFGVDDDRRIVSEPGRLAPGDWCRQGYPYYSGSMIYRFDYDREPGLIGCTLSLGRHEAAVTEIRVNGTTAGYIPWRAADRLELGDLLREGHNRIEAELMGTPRNLFGPFHYAGGFPGWTDWSVFHTEGEKYTPEYILRPYGLMEDIVLCEERQGGETEGGDEAL